VSPIVTTQALEPPRFRIADDDFRLARGTVYLFPGQGSQMPDMRERVRARCPELLDLVTDVVGEDPFASAEQSTRLLQPAIFCASIAGWLRAFDWDAGAEPAALAGHSLGELAALVVAGALSIEEGLRLVALRGELMERAAASAADGGMLAVLGESTRSAAEIASALRLTVAGDNAPGQLVLAGPVSSLERAEAEAEELGMRSMRLPIKGAFHTPAMEAIRSSFERAVRRAVPRPPRVPVFSCTTTEPFDDIAHGLSEGLTNGVRWRETLLRLNAAGARRFVEAGPGKVLTGLVRRTLPRVEAIAIDTLDLATDRLGDAELGVIPSGALAGALA
jgi:[acyl-carrier-protein] S-malonyltransferase